jgi:hypothetical protein
LKRTQRNTSTQKPLTPDFSQPTKPTYEELEAKYLTLDTRCHTQARALALLNKQICFALETLNEPLIPKNTTRPAQKMRKP